jgi:hypothetical protein
VAVRGDSQQVIWVNLSHAFIAYLDSSYFKWSENTQQNLVLRFQHLDLMTRPVATTLDPS